MNNDDILKLDNQLCFVLYAASREVIKMYRPLLNELGLTYPQYLVMLVLWENDAVPIHFIGDRLHLDTGTLTPLLKRLEGMGLIERKRASEDERRVDIFLTPRGKKIKEKAVVVPKEMFCQSGMTLEEFRLIKTKLNDLLQHLENLDENSCS